MATKPLSVSKLALSEWIQEKRDDKRLTPYHLAAKMGIPSSLVRAWESGESRPDDKQWRLLSSILTS